MTSIPAAPTSESVPVLSAEEERKSRESAKRYDSPLDGPSFTSRMWATLDAERTASVARIETLIDDAVTALHVRCQPVAPCSLPVGFATDFERTLRAALTSEAHRG